MRSTKLRKLGCGELISGIWRTRPKSVLVYSGSSRFGDLAVEKILDAVIAFEIFGNEFRGLPLIDAKLWGETEAKHQGQPHVLSADFLRRRVRTEWAASNK